MDTETMKSNQLKSNGSREKQANIQEHDIEKGVKFVSSKCCHEEHRRCKCRR